MIETAPIVHARVLKGAGGGPDKTILSSVQYLEERGLETRCLYLRDPEDEGFRLFEAKAQAAGVEISAVADRGPADLGILKRVRNVLPAGPFIWHGHDYKTNLLGLWLQKNTGGPLVTTVHGWVHHTPRTMIYYFIDRLCLRRYQAVLCVSNDLIDRCVRAGVPAASCRLVPNAIDASSFSRRQTRHAAKKSQSVPDGRTVIGSVGRLSPEKGFQDLIQAVGSLSKDLDLELWIVGEGEQEATLRQLIESLGLEDRVRLLGYQIDVQRVYEAMDVFVLNSLREGLPNVLLEAMSLGIPAVCTRVAGVPTVIQDGINGLLIEPGSMGQLISTLKTVLDDDELRTRLASAAEETVARHFDFSNRMESVLSVYEEISRR